MMEKRFIRSNSVSGYLGVHLLKGCQLLERRKPAVFLRDGPQSLTSDERWNFEIHVA